MTSSEVVFLDTNVLLRFLTRDDEERASGAREVLLRVERREEQVVTSPLVVFETVFTLRKTYAVPRATIRDLLLSVLSLRNLELPDKQIHENALRLYGSTNVSFADAYNVAYMQSRGVSRVYSWDTDFDRLAGIERVEPG